MNGRLVNHAGISGVMVGPRNKKDGLSDLSAMDFQPSSHSV